MHPLTPEAAHIIRCEEWLDRLDLSDPVQAALHAQRSDQLVEMIYALWTPRDCVEDRKRLLELAALNGAPAYAPLWVVGGIESWRCFLVSACSEEDLRNCRRAWS